MPTLPVVGIMIKAGIKIVIYSTIHNVISRSSCFPSLNLNSYKFELGGGQGSRGGVPEPFLIPHLFIWPHGGTAVFLSGSFTGLSLFEAVATVLLCRRVLEFLWSFCQGHRVLQLLKSQRLLHQLILNHLFHHACHQMVLFLKKTVSTLSLRNSQLCLRISFPSLLLLLHSLSLNALCHTLLEAVLLCLLEHFVYTNVKEINVLCPESKVDPKFLNMMGGFIPMETVVKGV
ncbi:uncharacterized protein LOC131620261 isoform X2 [Vicia villosa]|uniref:uncharacterized protein LOC131620261 isoform X2 n=1 Tax=Vicia villosa TaxID=3911 RepID=UPI00273BA731|nr:uncharacterized protein LOC131620261 isoform X2 [Vicia villosa]